MPTPASDNSSYSDSALYGDDKVRLFYFSSFTVKEKYASWIRVLIVAAAAFVIYGTSTLSFTNTVLAQFNLGAGQRVLKLVLDTLILAVVIRMVYFKTDNNLE